MTGGELVLASRSPQRRAILTTLGVPFRVRASDAPEASVGDPLALAVQNARDKARAVAAEERPGSLVLGADTVIVTADAAVGKPGDADEAAAMLRRWSGASHQVASAVALVRAAGPGHAPQEMLAEVDTTHVRFRELSDEEIAWYVSTGEWRGRAGGYAIQRRGALLVEGIDGDWWTVVGLPVALLARQAPILFR